MKHTFLLFLCFSCFSFTIAFTQSSKDKNWYLLDYTKDSVYGISLSEAYAWLENKKYKPASSPLIVAVIDSGIDTAHEDLKNVLWTNSKEKPGNGIDDDKNGYPDDIHGWNFLGNRNGKNLEKDIDEKTRLYYRFKEKYEGKNIREDSLNEEEKYVYKQWKRAAAEMKIGDDEQLEISFLDAALKSFVKYDSILKQEMKVTSFTEENLEKFIPETNAGKQAKLGYLTLLKLMGVDDMSNTMLIEELKDEVNGKKQSLKAKTIAPPDYRAEIVQDNYLDITDKNYGNADIMASTSGALHGTHVSGIIAADRNNNKGINGIANHVQIMMLRAVPDGDEYDKDIALAIRYAVDNGAKVINMSFGKSFSPEKKWVDDAVHYAEQHDVLLIHAAGNEAENTDSSDNFPNPILLNLHAKASNFITVGASGDPHIGKGDAIAYFSNYGKQTVNVFAPGVKIYSTLPGGNSYGFLQGTSMAAPVVSGIAALIRTYFPRLTAQQVKYVIENSAISFSDTVLIKIPGTEQLVSMKELCTSGGLVNAYKAVQLAATLNETKKK